MKIEQHESYKKLGVNSDAPQKDSSTWSTSGNRHVT